MRQEIEILIVRRWLNNLELQISYRAGLPHFETGMYRDEGVTKMSALVTVNRRLLLLMREREGRILKPIDLEAGPECQT